MSHGEADITITFDNPINNTDYDNHLTKYVWNFGDYSGKVVINKDMGGLVICANGEVEVNSSCDVKLLPRL